MSRSLNRARARRLLPLVVAALLPMAACNKDRILDVVDPDITNPTNLNSPEAAEALRIGALGRLSDATATQTSTDGPLLLAGLLADEWRSGDTFFQRDETDQRNIQTLNSFMTGASRITNRLRTAAVLAIPVIQQYQPGMLSNAGQMYWIRGFAETQLAENYCNGTPISSLDAGNNIIFGKPETNAEVYARAIASFDTALQFVPAGQARSDTVKFLAAIGKARVLMNLGRFAEAGPLVATVPDNFRFNVAYSQPTTDNGFWGLNNSAGRYVVADKEGGVGLNFATANDPRVPVNLGGSVGAKALDPVQTRTTSFDNTFGPGASNGPFYVQDVFPTREADVALVMGTEARLLEAETALRSGNVGTFIIKLNFLRANFNTFKQPSNPCTTTGTTVVGCPTIPTGGDLLPPLTDPGTQAAREDLLFRERAFWLYATGHRLADLRRLVRPPSAGGFGRAESTVYPTGAFGKGGSFGSDKSLILPQAEENNPEFHGCLDRNA